MRPEPRPAGVKTDEWCAWTAEQRYLYLERIGMGASEATALRQVRGLTKEQRPLFDVID